MMILAALVYVTVANWCISWGCQISDGLSYVGMPTVTLIWSCALQQVSQGWLILQAQVLRVRMS